MKISQRHQLRHLANHCHNVERNSVVGGRTG